MQQVVDTLKGHGATIVAITPNDLKGVYLSFGNDLAVGNGESTWTLPMPGRFVIDRAGTVRAADVDPDYEQRPEPQKTVDDVKALA